MAINVDLVYKTVLLILNQQQRGYITPDEFNKVGNQVQQSIFEKYASDLNQQLRIPENDSEYANRVKNLEEKLDIFKRIDAAVYADPYFNLPPGYPSVATSTQAFTVPVPAVATFQISNWTVAQSQGSLIKIFLDGVEQTAVQASVAVNTNIVTFLATPAPGANVLVQLFPSTFYRLGTVIHKDAKMVQMVERNELYLIQKSPLTAATISNPIFLYEEERLQVFPPAIVSDIKISYIKKPDQIKWGFTTGGLGQYIYDPTASINFELHPSEQVDVITGILLYSGVIIQDPTIIQVASQQIQQEDINEKS